ncbi:hypothetical protein [Staphylococcus epidermidis]
MSYNPDVINRTIFRTNNLAKNAVEKALNIQSKFAYSSSNLSNINSHLIEKVITQTSRLQNVINIVNSERFNTALYSEKILNEFMKKTTMPVEVVLELNNALKKVDYYKKSSTTTLDNRSIGKPVTTTDKNIDDFKELFNNRIFTPSVTLINDTAKTVFTQSITTFILKIAQHEPVDTSTFIWIAFFSYISFLISHPKN